MHRARWLISTVVLYHATYTINSLSHQLGSRRFDTSDDSRNNWLLAILTFGEGWHNNHHHYPAAARQGFYWWEIDLTYYGLRLLALIGLAGGMVLRNRIDTRTYRRWLRYALLIIAILLIVQYGLGRMA